MVVKVDVAVNHLIGLGESGRFVAVNTFGFEDGEEIFRYRIVIRVPPSCHRGRNAVFLSQVEVCLRGVLKS